MINVWLRKVQTTFHFYGSSLLFVYDASAWLVQVLILSI